jgi:hypothetical protein
MMWAYFVGIALLVASGLTLLVAIRLAAEWHEEKHYKPRMRTGK